MTIVDSSLPNVAAPHEAALPIYSLLSAAAGEYEVLRVLSSQLATTTLCVRHRATGELAELRFALNPSYSVANLTSANAIFSAPGRKAAAVGTSAQRQGGEEAMRAWRQNTAAWTRALSPVRAMGAHPHIQRLLDFGEVEMGFYVLLENVEGLTLRQILEGGGAQTLEWTLPLCVQIASALDFAAAQNLSHGNLTPDNILLSDASANERLYPSGGILPDARSETFSAVRLRDFGLSCLTPRIVSAYTSPEQAAGEAGDARSDIYAFGALLYACLSGRPPFAAMSRDELCRKIRLASPPPLAGQPDWARDIIGRAMQRTRVERYQVAMDIVTDLTFQRSPAQAAPNAQPQDCTLGHFIPALALREDAPTPAEAKAGGKGQSRRRAEKSAGKSPATAGGNGIAGGMGRPAKTGWLARLPAALLAPLALLRRPAGDPNAASQADAPDAPIHNLLGRFNRYMAIQEYVQLDPNDPRWRGWRGRLRSVGIRVPVPRTSSASSLWRREFRLALPPRLSRRLNFLKRAAFFAAPLTLLALCLHAAQRVQQHGSAWVFRVEGHPTVRRAGKKPVRLYADDALDALDPPTITTDSSHPLTLALADSRILLAPDSSLQITQMSYNGARQRRMELLKGEAQVDIAPEAAGGLPGYYDLVGNDILVQPGLTDTPTTLSLTVHAGSAFVRVARGRVTVAAHGSKKNLEAGKQLAAQSGKPLQDVSNMPAKSLQKLLANAGMQPQKLASLLTRWAGLYTEAQQKTVMPAVDRAMTLCRLKPGAHNNAVLEIQARLSLNAIHFALQAAGDLPATLDYDTLQETGADENARKSWLEPFAGHRLTAYCLENNDCILLARVNNQERTLLKCQDGEITVVPRRQEAEAIKKAESR